MIYKRLDASADSMRIGATTSMKSMTYDHVGGADGACSRLVCNRMIQWLAIRRVCMNRVVGYLVLLTAFAVSSGCAETTSIRLIDLINKRTESSDKPAESVDKNAESIDKHAELAESIDKQAEPADKPAEPAQAPVSMQPITYIVPLYNGLIKQLGVIEDLSFSIEESEFSDYQSTNRIISKSDRSIIRDTSVFAKQAGKDLLIIQRKTYNGNGVGSGKLYRIDFSVEKNSKEYKVVLRPTGYETYQEGLNTKFPVPNFDEEKLVETLLSAKIYYAFEVDSEFNSDAIHADFVRRLHRRPFNGGRTEGVEKNNRSGGKKFAEQFVLPYRGKEILFTLENIPYRSGSKAVMVLQIPAMLTSPNTVNYKIIIDEIKAKLTEIVKS
jgi:hypothetical protein